MEEFSGIPIKALLENDEKCTTLDLSASGCGVSEAVALSHCLKVRFGWLLVSFLYLALFLWATSPR